MRFLSLQRLFSLGERHKIDKKTCKKKVSVGSKCHSEKQHVWFRIEWWDGMQLYSKRKPRSECPKGISHMEMSGETIPGWCYAKSQSESKLSMFEYLKVD